MDRKSIAKRNKEMFQLYVILGYTYTKISNMYDVSKQCVKNGIENYARSRYIRGKAPNIYSSIFCLNTDIGTLCKLIRGWNSYDFSKNKQYVNDDIYSTWMQHQLLSSRITIIDLIFLIARYPDVFSGLPGIGKVSQEKLKQSVIEFDPYMFNKISNC